MNEPTSAASGLQLPASFFRVLRRTLSQNSSPTEAATVLREAGYAAGGEMWNSLAGTIEEAAEGSKPDAVPADQFWEIFSQFFQEKGWGVLRHDTPHPAVASLDSRDWEEADPDERASQPTCHFTTGVLAELMRHLIEEQIAVLEVECRSSGDDCCRFLLGGYPALERVYGRLRNGDRWTHALEALS